MGIVQTAQCDVYKTFSKVEQYEIVLRRAGDLPEIAVQQWRPYLSRRALRRAVHFIERGITSPPERTEKVDGEETENAKTVPEVQPEEVTATKPQKRRHHGRT